MGKTKIFMTAMMNLQLFSLNTNVTTDSGMSVEMKTFYDMVLLKDAQPNLVHDQFGQEKPIPQGSGKTIEFRKYAPLNKALTPLTEGVTPDGKKLSVSNLTATVSQYGDYVTLSDVLELTAIDDNVVQATQLIGQQAGVTLDTVSRNALQAGTNVSYASKWSGTTEVEVVSRKDLDSTAMLKVDTVNQIVAKFKAINAPKINGKYVAIIHPYVAYDLMRDPEWIDVHKYSDPENIYTGELGEIGGVRFVESSEAKIYRGAGLTAGSRTLTVASAVTSSANVSVAEEITADDAAAFAARDDADKYVYIGGTKTAVASLTAGAAGSAVLVLASAAASISKDTVIYDIGGTSTDLAVFGSLFLAAGAYGKTSITGGGLQTIIKQKGSAGTADPLDQRSTVGWKAIKVTEILNNDYIVRVESVSTRYSGIAVAN